MLHESVIWQPAAPDNMPDADLVVNVAIEGSEEPIWLGSWDGDCWRDTEGMEITVTHWADMLQGPSAPGVKVLPATPTCYSMARFCQHEPLCTSECAMRGTSGVPGTVKGGE